MYDKNRYFRFHHIKTLIMGTPLDKKSDVFALKKAQGHSQSILHF